MSWRRSQRALLLALLASRSASADEHEGDSARRGIYLEAPLTDGAINGADAQNLPTMQQSLWVATDVFEAAHFGVGRVLDPYDDVFLKAFFGRVLTGVTDLALVYAPFGHGWMHEEWHRA